MPLGVPLSWNICPIEPDGIGDMGFIDFMHSSKLFRLTLLFGSVNIEAKSLVSFLSFSCKAINSSSDKSGAALDVFTDDMLVLVIIEAAVVCSISDFFGLLNHFQYQLVIGPPSNYPKFLCLLL